MKNQNYFIPYLLIAILAFTTFNQCQRANNAEKQTHSVANFLTDSIRYYKNKHGQEIALKSVLQGDKNNLEILLSKQIDSTQQLKGLVEKYKKVLSAGNITTVTVIDTIEIPFEKPVEFEFTRDFNAKTDFYSINGISSNTGVKINQIEIPNTLSFVIGEKKIGLFKSDLRIEAVNSNPYIKTTGLDSYIYTQKQKRLGVSLYAGYGINSNLQITPQVGVGVSYSLLQLF
jgi:hypothetical protein